MPTSRRCLSSSLILFSLVLLMNEELDAQPTGFNYDESKVPKFELLDPLTFLNGKKVTTKKQWDARRLEIFD